LSEFGHFGTITAGMCLDTWGAGPFVIEVGDRRFTFEDSDRFGPLLLRRDGMPLDRQPGERHVFWRGYTPWRHQGRRVEDGLCVWQPFRPDRVRVVLVGRRRFVDVIEAGDDPFGSIEIVETVRRLKQESTE
jgi:hypothetical protein